MDEECEVIIIGGGPAGLTAGLYTSRARLNSLLIERGIIGGQITNAELVENYPGFPQGISGYQLGELMHQQAEAHGLKTVSGEFTGIELKGQDKIVITDQGSYAARALIVATGSERKKLGVPGEDRLLGKGVSYCALCDGAFFTGQSVAVVGGGDAALTEALFLAGLVSEVVLIHRRDQLRAARILQERAFTQPKLRFLWNTVVEEIEGESQVKRLRVRQVKTGEVSTLEISGVFIYAGLKPYTDCLGGLLPLDETGHILTNELMETEMPGIFAAGDVRYHSARQAITAAGDGATAGISSEKFLRG